MADANRQYEYFAFISYKREDEKWAKWLQRKLEYYKLPSSVRKDNPSLPEKIRPVFKDTTDLEPGVLAQKIQDALDSSKFLIVVCSPRSANSVWVSKEVQSFIDGGRADCIIPFIIGGTPNASNPEEECYPEGLRQLAGEQELLGANINEMGRDAAAIKVVARMFDLRFDTLWKRFEREKTKKRIITYIIIAIIIILSWGIGGIMYQNTIKLKQANKETEQQRDLAEKTNLELRITKDSLTYRNVSLVSLNNRLQILSDSVMTINKELTKSNLQLSKGKKGIEQILARIVSIGKDSVLLSMTKKTYANIGGQDRYAQRLIAETETAFGNELRNTETHNKAQSIKHMKNKIKDIEKDKTFGL